MFESSDDIDDDELFNGLFEDTEDDFTPREGGTNHFRKQQLEATCVRGNIFKTQPVIRDSETSRNLSSPSVPLNQNFHFEPNIHSIGDRIQVDLTNKENKRKHGTSPPLAKKRRERKFPGPAGLLPDRKPAQGSPIKLEFLLEDEKSPPKPGLDEFCSQGRCSGSILQEEPWQNFLTDLGESKHILDVVNVASVKRKAAARCFMGKKVPFLAAVLHHLDVSSPDPCIILRDSTGEIHGTLHREVWGQFAAELLVGSVLVIRNVGLLSTGISARRHYLNITAKNIVTIYSANQDNFKRTSLHQFTSQDFVQTIEQWRTLINPGVGSPSPLGSPMLFNSSVCSPSPNNTVLSPRVPISNMNGNCSFRRTNEVQRLINPIQRPNVRPIVSRNVQNRSNNPHTLQQPRVFSQSAVVPRPFGKNLLPSFKPRCFQGSPNPISSQPEIRHLTSANNTSTFKNRTMSSSPAISNEIYQTNNKTANNLSVKKQNAAANGFNFNPVIVKSNTINNEGFSQSNLVKYRSHFNGSQSVNIAEFKSSRSFETGSDFGNNNTKVVLSQSTQLSAEDQSVVENVFDGIDADSLFDDDF